MSSLVKLKILDVRSLNCFVAKEIDSNDAKYFEFLEEAMQKEYSESSIVKADIDVKSYVAVNTNLENARKPPNKWFRAVVRNVFISVGTYLYDVYLLDYDLKRVVKRTEVRELYPQFKDDYSVHYQILTFHLGGIKLKDGLTNSKEGKLWVKEIIAKNDDIVSAKIMSQTNSNRLGLIYLKDGSDLRQHYLAKGWVDHLENIGNSNVRKLKISPIFEGLSNTIVKNRESQEKRSFSDKNSVGSDSLSSVISVNISIDSEHTQIISDEEEFTLNFVCKLNEPKKAEKSDIAIKKSNNEINGFKLKYQTHHSLSENRKCDRTSKDESESGIKYISHFESNPQNQVDWPLEQIKDSRPACKALPAGLQPPRNH